MNATLSPLSFPIEARFVVTEDTARASLAALKHVVMPRWVGILVAASLGLQMVNSLLNAANPTIMIGVLVVIGGSFALVYWLRQKKAKRAGAATLGKEITVRFFDDGLDFGEARAGSRIGYSVVTRVGRNENGLVIVIGGRAGMFIPTEAFESPAQRDFVFSHVGRVLKKK